MGRPFSRPLPNSSTLSSFEASTNQPPTDPDAPSDIDTHAEHSTNSEFDDDTNFEEDIEQGLAEREDIIETVTRAEELLATLAKPSDPITRKFHNRFCRVGRHLGEWAFCFRSRPSSGSSTSLNSTIGVESHASPEAEMIHGLGDTVEHQLLEQLELTRTRVGWCLATLDSTIPSGQKQNYEELVQLKTWMDNYLGGIENFSSSGSENGNEDEPLLENQRTRSPYELTDRSPRAWRINPPRGRARRTRFAIWGKHGNYKEVNTRRHPQPEDKTAVDVREISPDNNGRTASFEHRSAGRSDDESGNVPESPPLLAAQLHNDRIDANFLLSEHQRRMVRTFFENPTSDENWSSMMGLMDRLDAHGYDVSLVHQDASEMYLKIETGERRQRERYEERNLEVT